MQEIQRRGFIRKKITDYVTQDSPFIFNSTLYIHIRLALIGLIHIRYIKFCCLVARFFVFQSSDWLTKDNRCQISCFGAQKNYFTWRLDLLHLKI